jgi:hypothetical protein
MESNRGGKREGSGRKRKFSNEETTTISFRCPISCVDYANNKIDELLTEIQTNLHEANSQRTIRPVK